METLQDYDGEWDYYRHAPIFWNDDSALVVELAGESSIVVTADSAGGNASGGSAGEDDEDPTHRYCGIFCAGSLTVRGTGSLSANAGGMEAKCYVSMIEYNFLKDYSFEEDNGSWVATDLKKADQLYIEDKKTDSLTGSKHMHFWSAAKDSVEFTLEQTLTDLPEGKFRFAVSVMGGDCGETDIYAYVKINGEETARSEQIPITGWNSWNEGVIPEFDHPAGSEVTVGLYVRCQGSGNGAWGKIDDATLNSVQ